MNPDPKPDPDAAPDPIRALFDRARELSGDDREAYLEGACAGDPSLRARVDRLLAQDEREERGEGPFGPPGDEAAATRSASPGAARGHHVRCPHCHGPIEVVVEGGDAEVTCPSCGSAFRVRESGPGGRRSTPRHFGRFEDLEPVGEGGFGAVFRAFDPRLRRVVALKIPRAGQFATADDVESLFREARNAARLRHPGIVPVHEVGAIPVEEAGGSVEVPYIVSDFIDGPSLQARLRDPGGPPGFREAAELAAQIAEALHEAHRSGVVHRDIKPGNILIDRASGRPLVTDFGLAKHEAGEVTIALSGQVLGTPAYMSPEQAEGRTHRADARTDVYSLGVVLYQMLTGDLPFAGSPRGIIDQIVRDEPRPPRVLYDRIPRDLETITLKAMAKEPHRRYQTAADLAADLRRWLAGRPIEARPAGRIEKTWRWSLRHPAAAGLIAVSLVAAAALAAAAVYAMDSGRLRKANRGEALARARADAQALAARKANALLGVNQAGLAWKGRRADLASDLLDRCEAPFRAWEWHYLDRLRRTTLPRLLGRGEVAGPAFSPDGRRLASCDPDGVHVVDADDGREVHRFPNRGGIRRVAFSPDGLRLAAAGGASDEGRLDVWNAETGRALLSSAGVPDLTALAFSPDGLRLVGCGPGKVAVWDMTSGRMVLTLDHEGRRSGLAFSPDARRVAVIGDEGTRVWDTELGRKAFDLPPRPGGPGGLAFSPDGRHLAISHGDGTIRVHDAARGGEDLAIPGLAGYARALAFSPDGRRIFGGGFEGVRGWDAATGREVVALRGAAQVAALALSPDGRRLVARSRDGEVLTWDLTSVELARVPSGTYGVFGEGLIPARLERQRVLGNSEGRWLPDHGADPAVASLEGPGRFTSLTFSPDGRRVASSGMGGIRLWDTARGPLLLASGEGGGTSGTSIAFSPDGRRLAGIAPGRDAGVLSGEIHRISVWEVESGRVERTFDGDARASALAFSPDGLRLLVSTSGDLRCWSVEDGRLVFSDPGPVREARALAYRPGGGQFALVGARGAVVCDAETGRELATIAPEAPVSNLAYSPDGARIALACRDGLRICDADTGRVGLWIGPGDPFAAVAFSPDGRQVVASGEPGNGEGWGTRTWDTRDGREVRALMGPRGGGIAVAFSPDGRRIASAGLGGLRIFDAESGQQALELPGPDFFLCAVAFGPDGRRVAAAGIDGSIQVWDGTPADVDGPAARRAAAGRRAEADRLREAEEAFRRRRWFAASWALGGLVARRPDDAALRAKFEIARGHLQAESGPELPADVFAR